MTRSATISHWSDGKPFAGTSTRTGSVTNSDRRRHRHRCVRDGRGRPPCDRLRRRGLPRVARHLAGQAHPDPVQLPRAAQRGKQELAEIITAEHGKVVSDALGEVSRGLEVVEFACGMPHLLKAA